MVPLIRVDALIISIHQPISMGPRLTHRKMHQCGRHTGPCSLLSSRASACVDEGALSFVTSTRFPVGVTVCIHTNENWRKLRMAGVPRLSRPARGACRTASENGVRLVRKMAVYTCVERAAEQGRRWAAARDASRPTHPGGNTAVKG